MKKLFLFLCSAFVAMSLSADRLVTEIWPSVPPTDVKLQKGSLEQTMGDDQILRITKMPRPTLELFEVKNSNKNKVIIICPGGGYNILAVNHEGTEIAQWLNSLGYTAYILRYRVPNEREGALQDAQRAIRLVRAAHPDKQVGIMGFSAGASLSARAATRSQTPSYTATDDIDRLSCRPDFAGLIYPAYMDLGENHTLTPELTVNEKTPPFFVFQTADDFYGNSSLVITQALRNHKVPVELHVYPTGGHGYGLRAYMAEAGGIWPGLMADWLNRLP